MKIQVFAVNAYSENTYILSNENTNDAVIIDCGVSNSSEETKVKNYLSTHNLHLVEYLITHTHPDHICGSTFITKNYGVTPQSGLQEGTREVLGQPMQVIATPGHKEDSVCFYFPNEGIVFTGDTLFCESVGRTDLGGGDWDTLLIALKKLLTLPDETRVYPGHGGSTTIGHEKQYNPFIH